MAKTLRSLTSARKVQSLSVISKPCITRLPALFSLVRIRKLSIQPKPRVSRSPPDCMSVVIVVDRRRNSAS